MTIRHFAETQNLVFVPALLAALVATVAIVLPVVFAPGLSRSGRRAPLTAAAVVVAVASLVVAGWQAGGGFRTLHDERARVGDELRTAYGIDLGPQDVGLLVDGGTVRLGDERIHLRRTSGDGFEVLDRRRVLAPQA